MMAIRMKNGLLVAVGFAAMFTVAAAREVSAEQSVPVQPAVQTTVGSQDVPMRTALYGESDRDGVKYEPVRSRGRGWYGGYRGGWYGGYQPYYRPRYFSYYPYYQTPYYSYYGGPRYGYYAPRWTYRAPMYAPYGGYYRRWW